MKEQVLSPIEPLPPHPHPHPPPHPRPRLLVVEDSVFIVMALESVCEALGWEMVGPATNVESGVALAKAGNQDVALLDVTLEGQACWPVAAELKARGIPFAFATGHDLSRTLPAEFAGVPVLQKPFRMADLEQLLPKMLAAELLALPKGDAP